MLPCGTRKTVAPASAAAVSFSSIPPIGITVPSSAICPVPAIVRPPVRSPGVSRSYRPSAHIRPAEGPPISPLEICTSKGKLLIIRTPTNGFALSPHGSRTRSTVSGSPSTDRSNVSVDPDGAASIARLAWR